MKKSVLITGASTGIGFAVAEKLQQSGFHVYAGARKDEDLKRLTDIGCEAIKLDVLKDEDMDKALVHVTAKGGLDALINNAGVAVVGPVEGLPIQELYRQMEVNFFSVYKMTQKFLPLIRKSHGRIVNIGSIAGKITPALFTPYSCSKFAVEAFSDGLRREVSGFGVKVSLVEPSSVRTPIWEKSKKTNEETLAMIPAELQKTYSKQIDDLRKSVDHAEKTAVPVSQVSDAVYHALTSSNPKTRYVVGREAKVASVLTRVLPDKILDRIIKVV